MYMQILLFISFLKAKSIHSLLNIHKHTKHVNEYLYSIHIYGKNRTCKYFIKRHEYLLGINIIIFNKHIRKKLFD